MISKLPIVDLHCDLLAYLSYNRRNHTPLQPESNCSLPLLQQGGVQIQTFAVFAETSPHCVHHGLSQLECYHEMLETYSSTCQSFTCLDQQSSRIQCLLALENASALIHENEPLTDLFQRLDQEDWLYVSATWNTENRFGGGSDTRIGLKPDGERLLEYLNRQQIAIDLSHTSDWLASDILNYIDRKGLELIPIASHSNFRSVHHHPRNLPDDIAREIIRLKGVIGLNFVRHFIGERFEALSQHIQHAYDLGGQDSLCLGADFFAEMLTQKEKRPLFLTALSIMRPAILMFSRI